MLRPDELSQRSRAAIGQDNARSQVAHGPGRPDQNIASRSDDYALMIRQVERYGRRGVGHFPSTVGCLLQMHFTAPALV